MPLLGKYVVLSGEEYFHSGKIIEEVAPNTFLIEFDNGKGLPYQHIFHLDAMFATTEEDGSINCKWNFFATKEDVEAWFAELARMADSEDEDADETENLSPTRTLQ